MKNLFLFLLLFPLAVFAQNQPDPGFAKYRNTALSSTQQQVKGGAANIFGFTLINAGTATAYVKIYDGLAANVTVGTTVPIAVIPVPPASSGVPATIMYAPGTISYRFVNFGLTIAAVTGLADNSTTAPSTAIYMEALYK